MNSPRSDVARQRGAQRATSILTFPNRKAEVVDLRGTGPAVS